MRNKNQRQPVQWYGSHPLEGSVSMHVYREQLLACCRPSDPYLIGCWPRQNAKLKQGVRVTRGLAKYFCYPLRVVRGSNADIVHFLDHSVAHLIPSVRAKKIVATLHDLIPLRYSGDLTSAQVERFRRTVSYLQCCDALVAVSEYSKQEAISLLDLPPEKIFVIPNGVNRPAKINGSYSLVDELRKKGAEVIILSVGSNQERKNLRILPDALRVFRERSGKRVALLRVGARLDVKLSEELQNVCGDLFVEAGRLEEHFLWKAYANCDLVIVPSLYEGYGLPVIEALSCGKGVAASNRSSLPEVGGSWVEYFDPASAEQAGEALLRVAQEIGHPEREEERRKAVEHLTWRNHLEGIFRVYHHLESE